MNTSCKECEFAVRDTNNNQDNCALGRITLYTKQGVEIESEGNPSSFLIKDRICSLCRAKDTEWGLGLSLRDKALKARDEVKVKITAIVVCDHNSKVEDILATTKSLENQNPPIDVHFALTSNKPQSSSVISALRKNFPQTGNLSWNVRLLYERKEGRPLEKGPASDVVINNLSLKDSQFYLLIDPGAILWSSFSADIDSTINDKLDRFIFLHPVKQEDGKEIGPLVHTKTHLTVGGNAIAERTLSDASIVKCDSVYNKINLLAKDQNLSYLIKDLIQFCPQV